MPDELKGLYEHAGHECNSINGDILAAQGKIESVVWHPDVISGKRRSPVGAMGVAQFMPGTWKTWGHGGNPFNPSDAIAAQARFDCALAEKVAKYHGNTVDLMLAAYNSGPGAVEKYHGVPPFLETINYIKRIRFELKGVQ